MSIFFTGDQHFDHTNIIKHCNRPFADKHEMNETIIENFNAIVGPHDKTFHLGDFTMGKHKKFLLHLNGDHHLIIGNHDRKSGYRNAGFEWVKDVYMFKKTWPHNSSEKIKIWLSHYAHRVWPSSHHGAYHVYGHSHGMLPWRGLSMDVGVDACGFQPASLEQVIYRMGIIMMAGPSDVKE